MATAMVREGRWGESKWGSLLLVNLFSAVSLPASPRTEAAESKAWQKQSTWSKQGSLGCNRKMARQNSPKLVACTCCRSGSLRLPHLWQRPSTWGPPLHSPCTNPLLSFPKRNPWDKTLGFRYLGGLHVANQNVTAIQHWLSINICTCILMHSNAMTI